MCEKALWIQHVAISVRDINESVEWYRDMLGFQLGEIKMHGEINAVVATMELGNIKLEIFQHNDTIAIPEERRNPATDIQTQGTKHFCLGTNDLSGLIEKLKSKSIDIAIGPEYFDDSRFVYVRDNNGILIEIMQTA